MSNVFNILLTNSSDIYGGGEFFVAELAKALATRGHHVWVSCRPENLLQGICEKASVPTFPLEFPAKGQLLKFISTLKQFIGEYHIDIVHTNGNYDRTAGAFAAWRAGVGHVTNIHSLQSIEHNLTHRIRNKVFTDWFLADGVRVKDLLVNHDHISASKVSVFYHGVNPEQMRRDKKLRNAVRSEFQLDNEEIVIGNVARFVPMKGHQYLINAFADVVKQSRNVRLLLVGDGELYKELVQLAQTLRITDKIIFAGFRDDLTALYSAFDLYAHSSLEGGGETISFAVQQALAQELPVVVTNVGDVSENVREGINGFVVPDRNSDALAEKLLLLVNNFLLRESMGKASRKYLLERFTTEHMVVAVEAIYKNVLQARQLQEAK